MWASADLQLRGVIQEHSLAVDGFKLLHTSWESCWPGGHPVLVPSLPPQPSSQNSLDFWQLEGYCVALGKPPGSYWHILPLL